MSTKMQISSYILHRNEIKFYMRMEKEGKKNHLLNSKDHLFLLLVLCLHRIVYFNDDHDHYYHSF